jgi:hypothetical protein
MTSKETLEGLWNGYEKAAKPLGSAALAMVIGAASYEPGQKDWSAALPPGRSVNILDLTNIKRGWEAARDEAARR